MNYIELTKQDMEMQRTLLKAFRKTLSSLPQGRLSVKKIKGRTYYYHIDEKTKKQTYIQKGNLMLIHQLKEKRWLEKTISIMEKNLNLQEKLIKEYRSYDVTSIQNALPCSYDDAFLREYERRVNPNLQQWAEETYRKNPFHQDELIHTTSFGLKVHSKGELIIAELLYKMGIPFRYDAAVKVKD